MIKDWAITITSSSDWIQCKTEAERNQCTFCVQPVVDHRSPKKRFDQKSLSVRDQFVDWEKKRKKCKNLWSFSSPADQQQIGGERWESTNFVQGTLHFNFLFFCTTASRSIEVKGITGNNSSSSKLVHTCIQVVDKLFLIEWKRQRRGQLVATAPEAAAAVWFGAPLTEQQQQSWG